MAEAGHEYYRRFHPETLPPWHELHPTLKASNEDAAAHGDIKLDTLGWTCRRLHDGESPPRAPQVEDRKIELLAQVEHNRWLGERLSSGWRYGEAKGDGGVGNKRRDMLVPWEKLTKAAEMKDIRHIKALAQMYATAGHAVEPASSSNPTCRGASATNVK
jgi:hypothetical protein